MCSCLFMVPTRNDSRTSSRSPQPTNGRLSASTCSAPSPVRIVLDTGVLVRANAKSTGPARELLTAILGGPHELITSAFLLDETARVLRYPRLLARHGLNEQEIEEHLDFLRRISELVDVVVEKPVVRDPDDDPVLYTALDGRADELCT